MFSVTFKRLYFVCDKIIIRNFRNNRIGPGLNKRSRVFQKEGIQLKELNVEDFVEESEGNFLNVSNLVIIYLVCTEPNL